MPDTNIPLQALHVVLPENITHQSLGLSLVKVSGMERHNARSILTAMLQDRQRIIDGLVDTGLANNSDQTTHSVYLHTGVRYSTRAG